MQKFIADELHEIHCIVLDVMEMYLGRPLTDLETFNITVNVALILEKVGGRYV